MVTAITKDVNRWILTLSIVTSLFFVFFAVIADIWPIAFIPIGAMIGVFLLQDLRYIYFLFALLIPFSVEIELPGGLGTDLPSEPIMWLLTGLSILFFITKSKTLDGRIWQHPISLLLLLHISWIGITTITSQNPILSFKYLLAKFWYVIPFYFLFYYAFRNRIMLSKFFDVLIGATTLAIMVVNIRHAMTGFAFAEINPSVSPIFRNHVNYAVMLVVLVPYIYLRAKQTKRKSYILIFILFLIAIYFSYTRAAIVALFVGFAAYYILRWKLTKVAMIVGLLGLSTATIFIMVNNRFMDLAPNYEKTIAHYEFDNLLKATYKLEDISTMERLYRWMAGVEMVKEKPWFGFGPASFYANYKDYSISAFQTYVSNNPDKSGIHNYYLMTTVEQGVIGGLLFILLLAFVLLYAENLYSSTSDPSAKRWIAAAFTSIVMLSAILSINDLIEADKVGPFFFISLSIVVLVWQWTKKPDKMFVS